MSYNKNEIVIYQADNLTRVEVKVIDETVWLNRQQISMLFDRDIKTIGKHINNVFSEGELDKNSTVANFATVQLEGGRSVERQIEYYNLDVIISVGYRVKSKQGTQFRVWANKVLKDYLLKGYVINNRISRIEDNVQALAEKVNSIDLQINTNLPPKQCIFFEGEVFDSYVFVSELIKKSRKSIILIDNYIDETILTLLAKRDKNIDATIYTKIISKQLKLDLSKHNQQYPKINIKSLKHSHDRFLIIDKKELYHLGASLKDLGKKWFAFSKMDSLTNDVLKKLNEAADE
jgi:hypothetical protein